MSIEVYAFEDKDGNSVSDYTTQDIGEARKFAVENSCRIIACIFEFADCELVESYVDGDMVNSEEENIGDDEEETQCL